jgi:glycosyltransferase involved in cell wall biosynthesis
MQVHLYTMCRDEEDMLGFFFRHYDPVVDRYFVLDDGSRDATLALLHAHPRVTILDMKRAVSDSFNLSLQAFYNQAWKASRGSADWVILADVDEHLHHRDLRAYLAECRSEGATLIPALGYQMISLDFPCAQEHLSETRTRGAPDNAYSKVCVLNPNMIAETNFRPGSHAAAPKGKVKYPDRDECLLLHYKFLGIDYIQRRNRQLASFVGRGDAERGFGGRYSAEAHVFQNQITTLDRKAIDIADPQGLPIKNYPHPRWWRKHQPEIPLTSFRRVILYAKAFLRR